MMSATCVLTTLLVLVHLSASAQPPSAPLRRSAQLVLTIGDDSDDLATYAFASAGSVRASDDGRIFVFDNKECHIKVFDAAGKYMRTFGRKGAGPGEFSCTGMGRWEIVGSTVRVPDPAQGRVATFSLDGKHLGTMAMPSIDGDNFVVRSSVLRHGFTVRGEGATFSRGVWDPYTYVVVRRARPPSADTIGIIRRDFVLVTHAGGRVSGSVAGFGAGGAYAVAADSLIVVVDGYDGRVKFYAITASGARLQRTLSLGTVGRSPSPADLQAMDARIRSDPHPSTRGLPIQDWSDAPPRWSVASMAFVDGDGAIWVGEQRTERKPQLWTVLPSAAPAFSVELPSDFFISFARGDRIYGASTKDDVPVVRVYKLLTSQGARRQ